MENKPRKDSVAVQINEIVMLEPKKLVPHPKNPNKHSKDQIDRLVKLYRYQGIRNPIVVSRLTGFIIAGHGRWEAALKAKVPLVPVSYQEFENEDQEYAYMVSDNAVALWADLDLSKINLQVPELGPDFDIEHLAIKDFKLDLNEGSGDVADEVPDTGLSIVQPGQLWILGPHRLLCGDSTSPEDVDRLMGGENAQMAFTDPPYNIAYEGGSKLRKKIENDEMDSESFYDFLMKAYTNLFSALMPGGAAYIAHADTERVNFTKAFMDAGFHLSSVIIWAKNNATFGRQDYFWKHEPILYGWRGDGAHQWYGPNNEETIWNIDRPAKSDEHPTMKPVALVERALKNSSRTGDVVVDLFGGSGTTLIAAHGLGRKAYLMEMDPHYASIIVERWEKLTGQKAHIAE